MNYINTELQAYKQAVSNFNTHKEITNTALIKTLLNEYWNININTTLQAECFRVTIIYDYFSDYTLEKLQFITDEFKNSNYNCYITKITDSKYLTDEKVTDVYSIALIHI